MSGGPGTIGAVSSDPAPELPVARVAVDVSLAHLDRYFDYSVPARMAQEAVPGTRVRVRFAGRLVDGFVIERVAHSEHRLAPLERVVSPVPVLLPQTVQLARAVADRYAGSLSDVLRAAIPPRHARAEAAVLATPLPSPPIHGGETPVDPRGEGTLGGWSGYIGGEALVRRAVAGEPVRAVWDVGPTDEWPRRLATIAEHSQAQGTGMLVVLPDARDVERVRAAFIEVLGKANFEVLTADAGPQRRYAAFLRLVTGRSRIAIGTRGACFAPVPERSVLCIIDDGEETLVEPHAPGWHAREVLALRSHLHGAPLIAGGYTRSIIDQSWIESGWAAAVSMSRDQIRSRAPRVRTVGDDPSRVPREAWSVVRDGLLEGPVLVQVARRGYVPGTACQRCRALARCTACGGPITLGEADAVPTCGWCANPAPNWRCPHCHGSRLRAVARGSTRTAEELGRAFPDTLVIASGGDRIIDEIDEQPALVVATPGAEPVAKGGYAAVALLDAQTMLSRASLAAGEETVRRWFTAAALARPRAPLVITAEAGVAPVAALVRWDPGWFAARDLAERRELRLPPVRRSATVTGTYAALDEVRALLPKDVIVHGPLPVGDERGRLLLLADRDVGPAMTRALREAAAVRTARRETSGLDIRIDPADWGGLPSHA